MPRALLALIAICVASAATPGAARDYPYCIKGCNYGAGVGDCIFTSYEQCQATASGLVATCAANPNFSTKAEMLTDRSRQSRRRF
jgi:uncharacterized protein DUF3551